MSLSKDHELSLQFKFEQKKNDIMAANSYCGPKAYFYGWRGG